LTVAPYSGRATRKLTKKGAATIMVQILDDPQINGHPLEDDDDRPDWSSIFGAPDFTLLIKKPKTSTAREYEKRVNSVLKAVLIGTLNTGQIPDAAAILKLGPSFSTATGELAAADERARKILDILTEPANPWVMFAITGIPLIAQLMRNHEPAIKQAPTSIRERRAQRRVKRMEQPPRFTLKIPFIRKTIALRFRFHFRLGRVLAGFRSQTMEPSTLVQQVFSDVKVLDALRKMGAVIHDEPS
jgi:hypothetical protein